MNFYDHLNWLGISIFQFWACIFAFCVTVAPVFYIMVKTIVCMKGEPSLDGNDGKRQKLRVKRALAAIISGKGEKMCRHSFGNSVEIILLTSAILGDFDNFCLIWDHYINLPSAKETLWNMVKTEKTALKRRLYAEGYFTKNEISDMPNLYSSEPHETEGRNRIAIYLLEVDNYKNLFPFIAMCLKLQQYDYVRYLLNQDDVSVSEIENYLTSAEKIDELENFQNMQNADIHIGGN